MRKLHFIILATAALFASSCKPDTPDFTTSGTSTANDNTNSPLAKGNYWKYQYVISGAPTDTMTMRLTGDRTTFSGRSYFNAVSTLNHSTQVSPGYLYSDDHVCYMRASAAQGNVAVTIDMEYLDDRIDTGKTWTAPLNETGTINGFPARIQGTMKEKNISITLGGKSFSKVFHTQIDVQYDLGFGDGYESFMTYDFYIAKGIGIVRLTTSFSGISLADESLIDYNVK